jgi:hypothetical protein
MAIAYVQEFEIRDGDMSTANYDAVVAALDLHDAPDGMLIHTPRASTTTPVSSASSTSGSRAGTASGSSPTGSTRSSSR